MEREPLSPDVARVIHDAAHQIVQAVLKDNALVQALYECQQPEKQAWMQALPEEGRLKIHATMCRIMERSQEIERDLGHVAARLAESMEHELSTLRYRGFRLEDTHLAYSDHQRRLNRCHEAINHVFACLYETSPDEVIDRLVKVAGREEFHDVFLLALHDHRPYLVRKYKVAWFKRLEAAVITAESGTAPRIG